MGGAIPSTLVQAKASGQGLPGQGRSDVGCSTLAQAGPVRPTVRGRRPTGWLRAAEGLANVSDGPSVWGRLSATLSLLSALVGGHVPGAEFFTSKKPAAVFK